MRLVFTAILLAASPSADAEPAAEPKAYIASYIDVAPAAKERAAALIRQLVERAPGVSAASPIETLQRTAPNHQFLLLTTWKDESALDAYGSSPFAKEIGEKLGSSLIAPIDDRLCIPTDTAKATNPVGSGVVHVVTHVDVPGSFRDQILPALGMLARTSRREPGNLRFDVLHQKARTNHFTVIEVWRDQASNDAHELSPHTREFRSILTPITGALYDQRWYRGL
jgi:autoinducer 2-degrading protein